MLSLIPIFPVYNFFRQNIWHSIFDQFYFHHIFGDKMSVIRQDRQQTKAPSRPPFGSSIWCVLFWSSIGESFWGPVEWLWERGASNIWMHSRKVNKYLYFSNLNFTMKGASVKKVILRFFSGNNPICHSQKFEP